MAKASDSRATRSKPKAKASTSRTKGATAKSRAKKDAVVPSIPASHRFPFELAIYTIEHLRGHKEGILACSLVCKGWYSVARKFIYHTIFIGNSDRYHAIKQLLERQEVRPWIRKLEIGLGWVSESRVQYLVERLPSIGILQFHGPQISFTRAFFSFTGVHELVFQGCYIADVHVMTLARRFPHLSSLVVLGGEVITAYYHPKNTTPAAQLLQIPETLRLESLVISPQCQSPRKYPRWEYYLHDRFFISLTKSGVLPSLKTLVIHMQEGIRPCPAEIGQLLDSLAGSNSNLEELSVVFPRAAFWEAYKERFTERTFAHLARCSSATHLFIANPIRLSGLIKLRRLSLGSPLHPAALEILAVPLPSVRQLTFEIEFHSEPGARPRCPKYGPLDKRLCHPDWKGLEDVCINYTGELTQETVMDILQLSFPKSTQKGLLRVTMNQDEVRLFRRLSGIEINAG